MFLSVVSESIASLRMFHSFLQKGMLYLVIVTRRAIPTVELLERHRLLKNKKNNNGGKK